MTNLLLSTVFIVVLQLCSFPLSAEEAVPAANQRVGGVGVGNGSIKIRRDQIEGRVPLGFFPSRSDYINQVREFSNWIRSGEDSFVRVVAEQNGCDLMPEIKGGFVIEYHRAIDPRSANNLLPGVNGFAEVLLNNCQNIKTRAFGEGWFEVPY